MWKQLALPVVMIALNGCSLFPHYAGNAPLTLSSAPGVITDSCVANAAAVADTKSVLCSHTSEIEAADINNVRQSSPAIEGDFIAEILLQEMAADEIDITDQFTELAVSHF